MRPIMVTFAPLAIVALHPTGICERLRRHLYRKSLSLSSCTKFAPPKATFIKRTSRAR